VNDDLRKRMLGIDPMATGKPTEPVTSESSRLLLEGIMTTETQKETPAAKKTNGSQRWLAAAAALIVVVGGYAVFSNSSEPAGPPLELALPDGTSMASCLAFSTEILAGMPVAFEGTASSVADGSVTLDVDHWYTGGDASVVILTAAPAAPALIGGVDFVAGEQYLVTATDGNVNACGYSGESTPEMRAAFEEAFGA
jgi:hypothetical protein